MSNFPTPSFSNLTVNDFDRVYEPAEDTFLLIDAIEKDAISIQQKQPIIALEMGPGSGIIITFLAKNIAPHIACFASDINSHASYCTRKTSLENGVAVEVTTDNLIGSFQKRLHNKVDILIFNPPYVVTPSAEVGTYDLSASWAGGVNGREVIDKFLPLVPELLSKNGFLYLLVLEQNKPDEIVEMMQSKYNLHASLIMKRKAGPEYLKVFRFEFIT
ncbi:methyltransferase N6AMT1-like isoform X1 [Clytia hemisphaerica]|uniref:methyltransferase N6AMT1-like isoform X1 n=2 Tax=Clytia hemisphaerica TaxID=252671 RepID=UPI0034D3B958